MHTTKSPSPGEGTGLKWGEEEEEESEPGGGRDRKDVSVLGTVPGPPKVQGYYQPREHFYVN